MVTFYRSRAKRNSLTTLNLVFLLLKTTLDCLARIVLFSAWLYVMNEGQFSSMMTIKAYYFTVSALLVFNIFINKNENLWSRRNIIGTKGY